MPTRFSDLTGSHPHKTAWNLDLITTFYTKCAYSPQTQVMVGALSLLMIFPSVAGTIAAIEALIGVIVVMFETKALTDDIVRFIFRTIANWGIVNAVIAFFGSGVLIYSLLGLIMAIEFGIVIYYMVSNTIIIKLRYVEVAYI